MALGNMIALLLIHTVTKIKVIPDINPIPARGGCGEESPPPPHIFCANIFLFKYPFVTIHSFRRDMFWVKKNVSSPLRASMGSHSSSLPEGGGV